LSFRESAKSTSPPFAFQAEQGVGSNYNKGAVSNAIIARASIRTSLYIGWLVLTRSDRVDITKRLTKETMSRPTAKLQLDNYLPYLINRVGSALAACFTDTTLKRHRLSIMMWRVLVVLSNNGGRRLVDLSQMTSIDLSTLSRMVARLVRLGLVSRKRSKASDREVLVTLTSKGHKLLVRIIPIGLEYEKEVVRGISHSDLAIAQRVLKHLYVNLPKLEQ
jgi:MarR family transcriptional regulator, organic hydroperoxide resistance regulator